MKGRRYLLGLAVVVWVACIAGGFFFLIRHQVRAGAPASPLPSWPQAVPIAFDKHRANLILFAHPGCPCTAATLTELVKIMTRCGDRLAVSIVFFSTAQEEAAWRRGSLWRSASAIPGIRVLADPEGRLAARFGALTSGQVFLFDAAGRLLFSGGITGSRGHEGDNSGADAVASWVIGQGDAPGRSPVFGCSLAGNPARKETP